MFRKLVETSRIKNPQCGPNSIVIIKSYNLYSEIFPSVLLPFLLKVYKCLSTSCISLSINQLSQPSEKLILKLVGEKKSLTIIADCRIM